MIITIPCSPDQEDVIADHVLSGGELGMQPDERAWIFSHTKHLYPTAKILAADLNIEDATWAVQIKL